MGFIICAACSEDCISREKVHKHGQVKRRRSFKDGSRIGGLALLQETRFEQMEGGKADVNKIGKIRRGVEDFFFFAFCLSHNGRMIPGWLDRREHIMSKKKSGLLLKADS